MTRSMACYVKIKDNVDSKELIEIPTEKDGTLLLSSVSAQFPDAVGLRFKTKSGSWRCVYVEGNIIDSPVEGWGDSEYYILTRKAIKRRADDNGVGRSGKSNKMAIEDILLDLLVAGLPYDATDDEVKKHFERFGELDMFEVMHDKNGKGKSRGFGFLRYKTVKAVEAALGATHIINNKKCELRYSKRSESHQKDQDRVPKKLFIGRLPQGTTTTDLHKHFGSFGVIQDVYIPTPFRGFGFVLFRSEIVANKVLNEKQVIKGTTLDIKTSIEKKANYMQATQSQTQGQMQSAWSPSSGIIHEYYGQTYWPSIPNYFSEKPGILPFPGMIGPSPNVSGSNFGAGKITSGENSYNGGENGGGILGSGRDALDFCGSVPSSTCSTGRAFNSITNSVGGRGAGASSSSFFSAGEIASNENSLNKHGLSNGISGGSTDTNYSSIRPTNNIGSMGSGAIIDSLLYALRPPQ